MGKLKLTEKRRGSLYGIFLRITLLPLICLGIVLILFSSYVFRTGLQEEVSRGLRSVGISVLAAYNASYPGDFSVSTEEKNTQGILLKGGKSVQENLSLLDYIKEETGVEITIFYKNIRMMTTLSDAKGQRYTGSEVNSKIKEAVLTHEQEAFFDNTMINGIRYYTYYIPLFDKSGACIGMIGTAKPATEVLGEVNKSVSRNVAIIVLALLLTAWFITGFTKGIVDVIKKIMNILTTISKGKFNSEFDELLLARDDELGEMAKVTLHVQASLNRLMERDTLTGLHNRKSGELKMNFIQDKAKANGQQFAIAIGDIDNIKRVNDKYGYVHGDQVLKEVADILRDHMLGKGSVIRWSGEEFLLLFEGEDGTEAEHTLRKIQDVLRKKRIKSGEHNLTVTMTFGLTDGDVDKPLNIQIREADEKLFYGKANGKDCIVF